MIFGIERLKSVPRTPSAAVRVLMYILCPSEGTGFSLIVARNFPPAVRLPSACWQHLGGVILDSGPKDKTEPSSTSNA